MTERQAALRLVVMGTHRLRRAEPRAAARAGPRRSPAVYTQPPRPAGRGQRLRPHAGARGGRAARPRRCARRARCSDPRRRRAFAALGADLARGRRLRADAAAADPRPHRGSAASTCTPRCCRAGAGRRRSSARSWPATPRPASRSSGWRRASTPARSTRDAALPIASTTTATGAARPAGGAGGRDAARGRGRARRRQRSTPTPQPAEGVTYAAQARRATRAGSTSPCRRRCSSAALRALNPCPGCWCEARGERLLLLAGEAVAGGGEPGTVIALPLTVACGEDALARDLGPARRAAGR